MRLGYYRKLGVLPREMLRSLDLWRLCECKGAEKMKDFVCVIGVVFDFREQIPKQP